MRLRIGKIGNMFRSLFNGKRFVAYPDCPVSSGILYTRIPNSRNISFLREHLSGGTLIDVGANVGSVSLLECMPAMGVASATS